MSFRAGRRSSRRDRVRVADIVGVPVLPTARVTACMTALRSALLWLYRRSAPSPLQVIETMLGVLDGAALATMCELGIPEALRGPMTLDALAAAVDADPERLERLMRFAAAQGWVGITRDGRVKPTGRTAFLRADHPGGWRAWVEFASSAEVIAAIAALPHSTGHSAFEDAHGVAFFDWMTEHPDRHALFDRAMDAGGRLHALALSAGLCWTERRRVCDIGGGTGTLIRGLLGEHLHLQGVLFDLPAVIARAEHHDRVELVGGDAFVVVPSGCDTYLLVNVIHDWGDDEAVALLARVGAVLETGGQVIVVDGERPTRAQDTLSARTDLLMLILTGTGKERTTAQFTTLGDQAGLHLDHTIRLATGDRAHVFVRSDSTVGPPDAKTSVASPENLSLRT